MSKYNNYFNIKFATMLLKRVLVAIEMRKAELAEHTISRYGAHDDFIYAECLSEEFTDLLPKERSALMQIVRSLINSSADAYAELVAEGYLQYEEFSIDDDPSNDISDFIERLESKDED